MPAINLEQALSIFNIGPLRGSDLGQYYVERAESPLELMAVHLRAQRRLKALFTGHRIAGKTTALNRLAADLADEFFVVHFSVQDTLNAYDVDYTDLMLALATRLLEQATDRRMFPRGLRTMVRQDLLQDVLLWLQSRIEGLQFVPPDSEKSLSAQVNFTAVQLEAKLSTETVTRQALRERVSGRMSELLDRMNWVTSEVERRSQRRALFIVEDIDKLDQANACKLFLEHARTLTAPEASIIYTFPVALRYSSDFAHIALNFGQHFVLPNVRLVDRDGNPNAQGRHTLERIFHSRLNPSLIDPEALGALIEASGGLVGTLVRLGGLAAGYALVDRKEVIDQASANDAVGEARGDFKAMLTKENYDVLRRQLAGERLTNEGPVRDALYNGSLLEYQDHDPWFGVHPIVRPLLEG